MAINGGYNGRNGAGGDDGDDPPELPLRDPFANVVRLPTREEREAALQQKKILRSANANTPPLFNIPPATKAVLGILLLVHAVLALILNPEQQYWVFAHLGFVPAVYSGGEPFTLYALAGLVTYTFIHANWIHLGMNGAMLLAMGSGVERWMGGGRMVIFFVLCSLASALAHFLLNPESASPVIGASGGISGLFAAVLVMMNRTREAAGLGHTHLLPVILLWVVVSAVFGMMGGPDGSPVAWAAHIGGFLSGFLFLKILKT